MASAIHRNMQHIFWLFALIATLTKHTTAVECPHRCNCNWILDSLSVNCSHLDLIDVPSFSDLPIEILDLSNNRFTDFPTELALLDSLTTLDLSNNSITGLPADALLGFKSLRHFYLGGNNISSWPAINPNRVLLNAKRLETFSLAGNPISTFSSHEQALALISSSLKSLDLSFCKISKITGNFALQGLANLESLILTSNPLETILKLESQSLKVINLSNCSLSQLPPSIFSGLNNLYAVDLSRNPLLNLEGRGHANANSRSLRRINLSFCNMQSVNLQGFPNVTTVLLRNNMIQKITETSFRGNNLIEKLDLSHNVITVLEINAFSNLRILKYLDLSFNMIAELDRNLFANNEILTNLNLSRNFLTKFSRFIGTSITTLDLSGCEIASMGADALIHMPIVNLNLSRNLISSLPDGFASQTIQVFDLSLNRISVIKNITFRHLPELNALYLTGNRFTTPFRADYFRKNLFLSYIGLEDNPWRCDCKDATFKQFFLYLTQTPPKITSTRGLKCHTPESSFGQPWDFVCLSTWFPQQSTGTIEKFWSVTMSILAVLCLSMFCYKMLNKYMSKRKRERNAAELRENVEEHRRIQIYNRQIIEQTAPLNAPDPREPNPPSYEVALLMPPLNRLTKSYVDITFKESNENLAVPKRASKRDQRNRYHSDNALLQPDGDERTAKIRRTPSFRRHPPRSRRGSRLVAVCPPHCPNDNIQTSESLGRMSNFVRFDDSPYARRKPRSTTTSSVSPASSIEHIADEGPSSVPLRNGSLDFIENFYVRPKSISNSGEEYEMVSSESESGSRKTSLRSSITSTDVGVVIVHNKPPSENLCTAGKSSEAKIGSSSVKEPSTAKESTPPTEKTKGPEESQF